MWAILAACGQPSWTGGIHAMLAWSPRGVRVVDVPEGPARLAGLEPEDRLVSIDGKPVANRSLEEIREQLAGEVGSFVNLVVLRDGEPVELKVERVPYRKSASPP